MVKLCNCYDYQNISWVFGVSFWKRRYWKNYFIVVWSSYVVLPCTIKSFQSKFCKGKIFHVSHAYQRVIHSSERTSVQCGHTLQLKAEHTNNIRCFSRISFLHWTTMKSDRLDVYLRQGTRNVYINLDGENSWNTASYRTKNEMKG